MYIPFWKTDKQIGKKCQVHTELDSISNILRRKNKTVDGDNSKGVALNNVKCFTVLSGVVRNF